MWVTIANAGRAYNKREASGVRMWSEFFAGVFVGAAMLFVPGYLFMRACRLDRMVALAVAPAVSIAGYQMCAILLAKLVLWANWAMVFFPCVCRYIVSRRRKFHSVTYGEWRFRRF